MDVVESHTQPAKAGNPMRQIITIVGIAIAVFLAFTAYSVQKSIQSSGQISSIKELYFPILERVDANIVRLDKMEEQYLTAVMTGEKDNVDQAAELFVQADKSFGEMSSINPERLVDINKIRQSFENYKKLADSVSADLLNHTGNDVKDRTAQMSKLLNALRTEIKVFRDSSYANFLDTLSETKSSVTLNLYLGLALGVMNLCFMGVLVYFVRNNVKMLSVIALQNETLEHRVAERTAELHQKTNDINAMLQNMKLGVCTVIPGNKIHPEYSKYLTTIFENERFGDADILETVFQKSTLGPDVKDQVAVALTAIVGEEAMMYDFNGHLLAREMQITGASGASKTLQMDWSPILSDEDKVDKVLLIVQDVTAMRELELRSAHQKEELETIAQIIKISIGKFNEFIASAQKFVQENRILIASEPQLRQQTIAALFRNMHTIKGNARTYEFRLITDAAHVAEQSYDNLRKDDGHGWDQEALSRELDAVEAAIQVTIDVNENKLGRKGRASDLLTTRGTFVGNEDIAAMKALMAAIKQASEPSLIAALDQQIGLLGLIPMERLVSGAVDSMASLSKELDKPTPTVKMDNCGVGFRSEFAEALKSSLMHIVRNSMDHGIESPIEREQAGKDPVGSMCFKMVMGEEKSELHISDDGRGLALHKLLEKGRSQGVFADGKLPSLQQAADLIFQSGLSTAQSLSMVSGRGVGMDAVKSFLAEHGASIRIALERPEGEMGFMPFKFVITINNQMMQQ